MLGSFIGPASKRREFLRNKIDKVLGYLPRLKELRKQDGLLLLRHCISQDLTHLLRCLDTKDIMDEWQRLDDAIEGLVDYFRMAYTQETEPDHCRRTTLTIYHLPIRMGGMGIQHYGNTRSAARMGSIDGSARFLESVNLPFLTPPLVEGETEETAPSTRKQSYQTNLFHLAKYRDLMAHLSEFEHSVFQDQTNQIHAAWMQCCPTHKRLTLSDRAVSAGLRQRTLLPMHLDAASCIGCGNDMVLNHQESCKGGTNRRTYRHNALRDLLQEHILKGLVTSDSHSCTIEPGVRSPPNSLDRTDLRIVGPVATNGTGNDYDLRIVAITNRRYIDTPKKVQLRTKPNTEIAPNQVINLEDETREHHTVKANGVAEHWVKVMEREKKIRYENRTAYPFQALIITTGGTMNKVFKELIKAMVNVSNRQIRGEISALLLDYHTQIMSLRNA